MSRFEALLPDETARLSVKVTRQANGHANLTVDKVDQHSIKAGRHDRRKSRSSVFYSLPDTLKGDDGNFLDRKLPDAIARQSLA